jgi:hypothetical protein
MRLLKLVFFFSVISVSLRAQDKSLITGGFFRAGLFLSTGVYEHDVNALSGDASFTLTASDDISYKGFADVRIRAGQQYGESINLFMLKETWITYHNDLFSISAGKKIVKWGKTDFFTPLSKFNPSDLSLRTPDREDSDLGNYLAELTISPASFIRFSIVASPLWNPSILMTRPMELPPFISLELPEGLWPGNGYYSFGARADMRFSNIDAGLQFYRGPDMMPGLSLVSLDLSNPVMPEAIIKGVPYIISSGGSDFEAALSRVVIRGAFSWSKPFKEKKNNEEIPFPQTEWVAGADFSPGSFQITVEYHGKNIHNYYKSQYEPLIGRDLNMAELAGLFSDPLAQLPEFFRLQTEAFNRLLNNQLKKSYHSAGLRIEYETLYGKLIPSITAMYNISSRDFLVMPVVRYKPADGLTLSGGIEHYSGSAGGLYDIIDDFMNSVFFSLRIDF